MHCFERGACDHTGLRAACAAKNHFLREFHQVLKKKFCRNKNIYNYAWRVALTDIMIFQTKKISVTNEKIMEK